MSQNQRKYELKIVLEHYHLKLYIPIEVQFLFLMLKVKKSMIHLSIYKIKDKYLIFKMYLNHKSSQYKTDKKVKII